MALPTPAHSDKDVPSPAQPTLAKRDLAIRSKAAVIVFLLLSAGGLLADLWSKSSVFDSLLNQPGVQQRVAPFVGHTTPEAVLRYLNVSRPVIDGVVKFTLSTNPGVVFGIPMPPAAVAVVSILTILLVFFFFGSGPRRHWCQHVGLAFILAGALGNLYDRMVSQVFLPGHPDPITRQVRDFIDFSDLHLPFKIFGFDNYPWIFNVADVLLVVGVLLLMLNWLLHRRDLKPKTTKPKAES